jgi:hypothetical protein
MSTQDTQNAQGGAPDVLEPVQVERIPFHGRELLAVRFADGRIAAALRWLCEGLGLETTAQMRRVRRTKAIRGELLSVRISTEGGPQVMPALTIRALPFWLAGLNTSRLAPELEPAILAYQLEAVDVLYRHFAERPRELSAPRELVPSEPIERPQKPDNDAAAEAWADYHERMAAWIRWQADISAWRQGVDEWRGHMESRLEEHEAILSLVPDLLERLGPETLSPEHQSTVKAMAGRLHEIAGYSFGAIYGELNAAFHVGKYGDIADAHWAEVVAWLKQRIEAAERQHKR